MMLVQKEHVEGKLVYPVYCCSESGQNPFPVLEFGQIVSIVLAYIVIILVITARSGSRMK